MPPRTRKPSSAERRWLPWLREHLHHENPGEVQLHQIGPAGSSCLERWQVGEDLSVWNEAKMREVVLAAEKIAAEDSEGMGGDNSYCLAFSAGPDRVIDLRSPAWTLRVTGSAIEPSEGPTEKGLAAQAMRHLEQTQKSLLGALETITTHYQRMSTAQAAELEMYRSAIWQVYELRENLLDRSEERKLAKTKLEEDQRLQYEMLRSFAPLVPGVVNRLAGKKLMPEHTLPLIEMAKQISVMFGPKEIEKIAAAFADDPEKLVAFLEFVSQMREAWEKQHAEPKASTENGAEARH